MYKCNSSPAEVCVVNYESAGCLGNKGRGVIGNYYSRLKLSLSQPKKAVVGALVRSIVLLVAEAVIHFSFQ